MDQGRVIVDFLIVLNMVLLTIVVIKCILAILTIDVMLLIYLIIAWFVDMYKGRRWCRYVKIMCTHRDKEGVCLAAFFIYQVALVYVWIVFKLT